MSYIINLLESIWYLRNCASYVAMLLVANNAPREDRGINKPIKTVFCPDLGHLTGGGGSWDVIKIFTCGLADVVG